MRPDLQSSRKGPMGEKGAGAAALDGWQDAQDRVLLYLKAMNVPPIRSLSLAQEVIGRAMLKARDSETQPVEAAMAVLRVLLNKRGILPGFDLSRILPTKTRTAGRSTCRRNTFPAALSTSPPVNRGPMVSEDLDRKPWLAFFQKMLAPVRKAATLVFNTQLQFLFFLIVLALLGPS